MVMFWMDGCWRCTSLGLAIGVLSIKGGGGGGDGSIDDLSGLSANVGGWRWMADDNSSDHVLDGQALESFVKFLS